MTDRVIRDINHEKGGPFTVKFIKWFDREWTGVVLAARMLKEGKNHEKV